MTDDSIRIVEAGPADIERVEPLWRSMVEYHRELSGREWPVRGAEEAWDLRRAQYREWISGAGCWLLLSVDPDRPTPRGYAVVRLHPAGPTWELGDQIGEIESLAVAEHARGAGIGTALIEAAHDLLRRRGVRYWSVKVVEKNAEATRLYRRHGFRTYYRQLLAEID